MWIVFGRGKLSGSLKEDKLLLVSPTLGADRIGEVDDRASEGYAAAMNGTGFTWGSLARLRARNRLRGPSMEVGSDNLREVGRMAEHDCGGMGE